jgi:hypothetical protein
MALPPFETLRNAVIAGAALLALMLTLLGPAPAGAVVGGEEVDAASVPWFSYASCGGTLVVPDRIVTAAHCRIEASNAGGSFSVLSPPVKS